MFGPGLRPAPLVLRFVLGLAPVVVVASAMSGCQTMGAAGKPLKDAERLRAEGKLAEARAAYVEAQSANPKDTKIPERLKTLDEQIELEVERLRGEARNAEKGQDFGAAARAYASASELRPEDGELRARRALAEAKSKNLDPDAWYAEVVRIAEANKGQAVVERALAGAKAGAYQYHLSLADKLLEGGDADGALGHYDRAKQLEPSAPGLDADRYNTARAASLVAQADLLVSAGDAVAAYEKLEQAVAIHPTPESKKKLADAKARSAKVLQKLDAARAARDKGRYQDSLRLYDELATVKGVPASASTEAGEVRRKLSAEVAKDAVRAADKKDWKGARSKLAEAVRYAEASALASDALKLAVDQAIDKRTEDARTTLVGAGLGADDPLFRGAEGVIAAAERTFGTQKTRAPKAEAADAGDARSRDDQKKAFQAALDEALAKAKRGEDGPAADALDRALGLSTAPDAVAGAARDGAAALRERRYDAALTAFQGGLAGAPKSSLLQRGVDVSRLRRDAAEKAAVETIRSGKGDLADAVATLERAREARPGEPRVAEAAKALVGRVVGGQKLPDGELAEKITQAARLSELSRPARDAVAEGTKKLVEGQYGDAEAAFGRAAQAAPEATLPEAAKKAARSRLMVALKAGARSAGSGDAASTDALKKLLKSDPDSADAKAGLGALLSRAEGAAKDGNWSDAATALAQVTQVTDPAPGVKLALDKGTDAMKGGKLDEAERAFNDAVDLEPGHPGAKLGAELTKKARVAGLKKAVMAANEDGSTEAAATQLEKTLTVDPNSTEARQAFDDLLKNAQARGQEQKDREAARLLDAANTVSKPETARTAIGAANALLGDGKHAEAEAAYGRVLQSGSSKVAETGRGIARQRRLGVLLAGVATLKDGSDLDRGAKATKELLAIEATSAEAKAAIDATLARVIKAAEAGDVALTARELRAADISLGTTQGLPKVVADLERNKLDEAEDGFGRLSGRVAETGRDAARKLKSAVLKQSMTSTDDRKAAESIRKVLARDPNDATAREGLQKILERAKTASRKGDDKAAAASLEAATIATGAPDDLAQALKIGAQQLGDGRFAEAEQAFENARELSKGSKVAELGVELARERRKTAEKQAAEILQKGTEAPEVLARSAQTLRSSLVVDPRSKLVSDTVQKLEARAKTQAQKGPVPDAVKTLDVLVLLEGLPGPMLAKVQEAHGHLAQGKLAEAEAAYVLATSGEAVGEVKPSKALDLGRGLTRQRLMVELKQGLEKAQKEKDLGRAKELVERILAIDPKDKLAVAERGKLGGALADDRYEAAMAQKGFGKNGTAFVYLERALELSPGHKKATEALAELKKAASEELDLIVRVDEILRGKGLAAGACESVESKVRLAVMSQASQRTDLGFFVLGAEWTQKVDKNEPDAPKLGASLVATLESCEATPQTAKATVRWKLLVPARGTGELASGTYEADVPSGLVPKDEQDAAAKSTREQLSKRLAAKGVEALGGIKTAVSLWPLVLAEQAMAAKDAPAAAEAYMKLKLSNPREVPTPRLEALTKYLADALR